MGTRLPQKARTRRVSARGGGAAGGTPRLSAGHRCRSCGGPTDSIRRRYLELISLETISVPDVLHDHCPKCSESAIDPSDGERAERAAVVAYRERHGILPPGEIRALRTRLQLTPSQLAGLLDVSLGDVRQWESGKWLPSRDQDRILRLIHDAPSALHWLRRDRGKALSARASRRAKDQG